MKLLKFSHYGVEWSSLPKLGLRRIHCPKWVFYANFNVNPIFAVTDPPYGIREPAAKVGTTKDQKEAIIPEEYLGNHIPQKIDYGLGDIFVDLLAFANLHMPCKGRLAFWIPVNREFYRCPNLNSS